MPYVLEAIGLGFSSMVKIDQSLLENGKPIRKTRIFIANFFSRGILKTPISLLALIESPKTLELSKRKKVFFLYSLLSTLRKANI